MIALSLTSTTGDKLTGVVCPVSVAAMSAIVTLLRGGRGNRWVTGVWDRVDQPDKALESEPDARWAIRGSEQGGLRAALLASGRPVTIRLRARNDLRLIIIFVINRRLKE